MLRSLHLSTAFAVIFLALAAHAQDSPTPPTFQGQPVYRVGGGILPPKALETPDPKYPEKMRRERVEGHVVLKLIVGTDGAVHEVSVDRSGGKEFDREAVKAAQHWKFAPATKDGNAVNVMVNIDMSFRLY